MNHTRQLHVRRARSAKSEMAKAFMLIAIMAALVAVFSSEPNAIQSAILRLEVFTDLEDVLSEAQEILGWIHEQN